MKSTEPRDLLNQVIGLIHKDLDAMKILMEAKMSETGQFSADLSRYATALLAINKDQDAAKDSAKSAYQKMTTEELLKLAQQAAETLQPKDGK